MAGKKFKFRVDGNNRVGIKENISHNTTIRGRRESISIGVDKEFNIVDKCIVEENVFTPLNSISAIKALKRGKGCKVVYYPLDEISYLVTVTLQYNTKNKIVDKSIILYTPQGVCSEDELYAMRTNSMIDIEEKEKIIEKVLDYVLLRIN